MAWLKVHNNRFLKKGSKYKEMSRVNLKNYGKARMMFQEMDLQRDMDELDKITMPS